MEQDFRQIRLKMNELGHKRQPFVFLLDFNLQKPLLFEWEESRNYLLWATPGYCNFGREIIPDKKLGWKAKPVPYVRYRNAFEQVQRHIHKGDSYLLNLTMPTYVETNYGLEDLFSVCTSLYKIYLKNQFVCFSPEIFVRIVNGRISSFPMKGTIDAGIPGAAGLLRNDKKELAEHSTIVDLIRNDLSMVATQVKVDRFGYLDKIRSNQTDLLQMSSEISGILQPNYNEYLGDIFATLLPAGSVSGAPKKETIGIIRRVENYDRGYYTGIFGIFDGINVDSCVLIRFIEKQQGQFIFKSGGGITHLSNCNKEYEELLKKVYVPVTGNN